MVVVLDLMIAEGHHHLATLGHHLHVTLVHLPHAMLVHDPTAVNTPLLQRESSTLGMIY